MSGNCQVLICTKWKYRALSSTKIGKSSTHTAARRPVSYGNACRVMVVLEVGLLQVNGWVKVEVVIVVTDRVLVLGTGRFAFITVLVGRAELELVEVDLL